MIIKEKYLVFPFSRKRNTVAVRVKKQDEIIEEVFANLCPPEESEDFYCVDMTGYIGEEVTLEAGPVPRTEWAVLPEGEDKNDPEYLSSLLKYVRNLPRYTTGEYYTEKYRPLVHFTTGRGWINDPNGCFYRDGKYHLYYQHCPGVPYSYWDNNHWGHAVSGDLFSWKELPPAIRYPHAASGAAFFEEKTGVIHSATGPYLLTSEDEGATFKLTSVLELEGGGNIGGDPKIFFYPGTGRYIAITLKDLGSYQIASSADLKKWRLESEVQGFRECPEFTFMKAPDGSEKAVLFGGDGGYIIGSFDGSTFTADEINPDRHDKYRYVMNETRDFVNKYNGSYVNDGYEGSWERMVAYAYQIFTGYPGSDPVRIAWMTSKDFEHGMPYQSRMSIPQVLSLKETGVGLRVCCMPVPEIKNAYGMGIGGEENLGALAFNEGKAFDVRIKAAVPDGENAVFEIGDYVLEYLKESGQMRISYPGEPDFEVPYLPLDNVLKIRAITDIGSTEFFLGEGEVFIPLRPDNYDSDGITVKGNCLNSIKITKLKKMIKE